MRRLTIARSPAEIEAFRPLWEKLERERSATMFQSYAWNYVAARLVADREQPHVVALESDAGAVIVPAVRIGEGKGSFLGEMLFDYRDVLAAGEPGLVYDALAEVGRAGLDLSLTAVREGAALALNDPGALTPWVGVPVLSHARLSPEAFLTDHFKARKQMHRLMRAGASFSRYNGNARRLLEWVYDRKAEQFAGATLDIFSDPVRRRCMVEIASACADRCDVFAIELGSRIAAVLVTFRDRGVRRLYTIWHDAAFEHFSPGIVLLLHACHESLREGLDVDFLTGEQPHKARFANARDQLFRYHATAAELTGRGAAALVA